MNVNNMNAILARLVRSFIEIILAPVLFLLAILYRFSRKPIDIGLGPEPLINNIYHKMALERYGYTAQTFVDDVYFVTDKFDVLGHQMFPGKKGRLRRFLIHLYLFIESLRRYKCLYVYFNGGALGLTTRLLWHVEPFLYKLANVKVVVMPYGSDIQEMSRSPNLLFKDTMARDYPEHRFHRERIAAKIDLWTKYADQVISGCEWVDYMYYWDTLMLAHFSIDVDAWKPVERDHDRLKEAKPTKLRILHAPNHRSIKGTHYFIDAVNELVAEGVEVELVILERVPNDEVKRAMATVDVVADQLIVGWYAMFALEAMAMEKPVLCFLRDDLEALYVAAGLVEVGEIPIIRCSPLTVKETIRDLALNRNQLPEIGRRSREYVIQHHSTEAVGQVFDQINQSLGIKPRLNIRHD